MWDPDTVIIIIYAIHDSTNFMEDKDPRKLGGEAGG